MTMLELHARQCHECLSFPLISGFPGTYKVLPKARTYNLSFASVAGVSQSHGEKTCMRTMTMEKLVLSTLIWIQYINGHIPMIPPEPTRRSYQTIRHIARAYKRTARAYKTKCGRCCRYAGRAGAKITCKVFLDRRVGGSRR
jgi:hypothetical protein